MPGFMDSLGGLGGQDKSGGIKYYSVCKAHYEANQTTIYKKFAGQPVMVNLVKDVEATMKCEVCKNNGQIS